MKIPAAPYVALGMLMAGCYNVVTSVPDSNTLPPDEQADTVDDTDAESDVEEQDDPIEPPPPRLTVQPQGLTWNIEYTLEAPGRVSMAVYNDQGILVRELLRGIPHASGTYHATWDGLRRDGMAATAGTYGVRLLRTPGFVAEYVTSLGIRPESAPYDSWVGTGSGVISVSADASGVYVAAEITETAPVLLKISHDGSTRIWTRDRGHVTEGRFQGGASLASNGAGTLYMLQQNGLLQVIDTEQGTKLATWNVLELTEPSPTYVNRLGTPLADMDAYGDTLVMSYRNLNAIHWLDPQNEGALLQSVSVPDPTGLAVGFDGEVFILSEGRLMRVAPDQEPAVLAEDLAMGGRVAVDHTYGKIFVAERDNRHQVRVYDSEGELLNILGREGGRLQGAYQPEDFLHITDIAADGIGGFFIAEGSVAPRRYAHFDADGELVQEWYGAQRYYTWGEPDPNDPTLVWFNSDDNWLVLAKVDLDNPPAWDVLETYHLDTLAGGLVRGFSAPSSRWRVLYRNSQRYLVSSESIQVLAHEQGSLKAVTVLGNHVDDAANIAGEQTSALSFRWFDANGDGEPQADEITFSSEERVPRGYWVTDDFSVIGLGTTGSEDPYQFFVHQTTPEWTDDGPLYPLGQVPERVAEKHVPRGITTGGVRGAGAMRDKEGNYYGFYNTNLDRHGESWPTEWGAQSRIVKWNADGVEQWSVGRHAVHGGLGGDPHTTQPGFLHVPAAFTGEVKNTIVLSDRAEWAGIAWTKDGLYVGSFLDARIADGLPDIVYYWWRTPDGEESILTSDHATSSSVVESSDGSVYWLTQGRNNTVLYKVHGWDGWERHEQAFHVSDTPPQATEHGTGLAALYFTSIDLQDAPEATVSEAQVWHGMPNNHPGAHDIVDGVHGGPTYDWSVEIEPLEQAPNIPFGVRWIGQVEAPLSEPFVFSVYGRGGKRLWLNGKQVLFAWNEGLPRWETVPIVLAAGQRYDIQLDYYSIGPNPAVSLNWESPNIDRQRIPTAYLYPEMAGEPASGPDARPAVNRIDANTFDVTNIETESPGFYTYGRRQVGFGETGAYLGYHRVDFGDGVSTLHVGAWGSPAGTGQFDVSLTFRVDAPDGEILAVLLMQEGEAVPEHSIDLSNVLNGEHDVYIVNTTIDSWHFVSLNWFSFE